MTTPSDPTGDQQHFRHVQELFEAALDLPTEQRAAFLVAECGSDEALRIDVTELLAADDQPTWTVSSATQGWGDGRQLPPGTQVGTFTIVRVIGEGGMGSVYEATQERPQRTVALKTLREGTNSPRARRRFEYESDVLGRLQHPGIAQIHEAGTYDDGGHEVPYLAMELLAGARPIDDYATTHNIDTRHVLRLFADICDAVQHAHQHGIVHRDLKPSNLLVDDDGRAKVIDFGIALAVDTDEVRRTLHTETGVILGTVAYMSPEQLDPDGGSPDARTDIYSLGIVLFQLLTGRLPHDLDTMAIPTAISVISERDLPRLQTYGPRAGLDPLERELDWILAKATEHDRERRYQTVLEMGADVRRYLGDRPLEVGPPSTAYRLRKFVRRHRGAVAGAAIAALALLVGTITTAFGWQSAVRAEAVTEAKRADLELVAYGFWQTGQMVERISQVKSDGIKPELLRQLDEMAAQLDGQSIERQSVEAALRLRLANTYSEFGRLASARQQVERAMQLLAADKQPMVAVRIKALNQMGEILTMDGKLERAVELLAEATTLAEKHGGPLSDPPARPRTSMAYALHQLGRYAAARDAYAAVLEDLKARAMPEQGLHFRALLGRGNARRALGDRDGAREDLEAAVSFAEGRFGHRDHRTLGARQDLAVQLLGDRSTLAKAEALLRSVAEARTERLGPTHAQTIATVSNLAFALHRQHKYTDSEQLCAKYVTAATKAGIAMTIPLMKLRFNLGVAQMSQQPAHLDAATKCFRGLIDDAQRELPEDHWMTMAFHARHGMCCMLTAQAMSDDTSTRGKLLDTARMELVKAVDGLEANLGGKNRQTIEAVGALRRFYEAVGEDEAAAELRKRFGLGK